MARKVEEWIGPSDDSRPPPRVQLRILEAHGWRCYLTGVEIRDGDRPHIQFDHKVALINGGANRESNLGPVFRKAHAEKTKRDVAEKAAVAKSLKKRFTAKAARRAWPKRPFPRRAEPWN